MTSIFSLVEMEKFEGELKWFGQGYGGMVHSTITFLEYLLFALTFFFFFLKWNQQLHISYWSGTRWQKLSVTTT